VEDMGSDGNSNPGDAILKNFSIDEIYHMLDLLDKIEADRYEFTNFTKSLTENPANLFTITAIINFSPCLLSDLAGYS
jgi:hypothetical protein